MVGLTVEPGKSVAPSIKYRLSSIDSITFKGYD